MSSKDLFDVKSDDAVIDIVDEPKALNEGQSDFVSNEITTWGSSQLETETVVKEKTTLDTFNFYGSEVFEEGQGFLIQMGEEHKSTRNISQQNLYVYEDKYNC